MTPTDPHRPAPAIPTQQQDRPVRPNPGGFWYLATPYSRYPAGMVEAFKAACYQTGLLIRAGVPVFSPIAHSHGIAEHAKMDPLDHDIWLPADRPMMTAARGLIVCLLPSWEYSAGVSHEIDVFRRAGKPIVRMVPGTAPVEVLS